MSEHLCVCAVEDDPTPTGNHGKIWLQSRESYGASDGTNDPTLLFETQDFAPLGPQGRLIARRIAVTVEFDAACRIRVTPIADFEEALAPRTYDLAGPSQRSREVLDVPLAKPLTWIRVRVEVLERQGLIWLHGISLSQKPLTQAYEQIAGPDV